MTKALVLSGGGSVGIAWQTGLAAGLARHGVQLADAEFIVGTSAGSAVGAQLALGRDLEESLDRYRQVAARPNAAGTSNEGWDRSIAERMTRFMAIMAQAMDDDAEPEARRSAIGRFALEAEAAPEDQFVAGFRYLQASSWPDRYACTAVDAGTGEFVVWDAGANVPLDRAVASSCAVPGLFAPITINGRRYMDGGMRSPTNADLAAGHDVVLLVSLMTREATAPTADPRLARYLQTMDSELQVLADAGARVEIIGPDQGAVDVMGLNLMDASRAPAAAEQGVRQGEEFAAHVARVWA
jgi:NTE family protein